MLSTYGQQDFVRDAVESVLSQTYRDVELIAIDNGSADATPRILEEYANDPRVRLTLHPVNGSINVRMNEGVRRARGEFISFLYGDDYYLPTKIERQMEVFAETGSDVGVVYGPGYRLDVRTGERWIESRLGLNGDVLAEMLRRFDSVFINPISPLARRRCFDKHPYHEDLYIEGEGIYLFVALDERFRYMDEPLVVMREHDRNIGKAYMLNLRWEQPLLDHLEREPLFPPSLRSTLRALRGRRYRNVGWRLVRSGVHPRGALACFREAVTLHPVEALHPRVLVGTILSALPPPFLDPVNRIIDRVRRTRGRLIVRQDYR